MTLQPVTIGGKKGRAAYFDASMQMVEPSAGVLMKVLFEDGSRGFYLASDELRAAEFNPDQPRDEMGRWTAGPDATEAFAILGTGEGGVHESVHTGPEASKKVADARREIVAQLTKLGYERDNYHAFGPNEGESVTYVNPNVFGANVRIITEDWSRFAFNDKRKGASIKVEIDKGSAGRGPEADKVYALAQRRAIEKFFAEGKAETYHGTTSEALASIREHGLVPRGGKGADSLTQFQIGGERTSSVFVTADKDAATTYGRYAVKATGAGHPVVLEVRIPKDAQGDARPDEKTVAASATFRFERAIPPEWISRVGVVGANGKVERWDAFRAASDGLTVYAVVLVEDNDLRAAEFDPNQPRDEKGRWTQTGNVADTNAKDKPAIRRVVDSLFHKVVQEGGAHTLRFESEAAAQEGFTRAINNVFQLGMPEGMPTQMPDGSVTGTVRDPGTGDMGFVAYNGGREITAGFGPYEDMNRIVLHFHEQPLGEQQSKLLSDYMSRHAVRAFHGTTSEALDTIAREGLKPAAQPGADKGVGDSMVGTRPPSVFMATDKRLAFMFAGMAASMHGGKPVVLQIEVPESERKNVKPDELMSSPVLAMRYEHTIPPGWIKRVGEVVHKPQLSAGGYMKWKKFGGAKGKGRKPRTAARAARGPMTLYAVLLVNEGQPRAAEFDPNQPRDEKGRWTDTGAGVGSGESGVVPGHKERYYELKTQWARVNDELLSLVDHPDAPETQAKMDELQSIVKEMYRLKADPGGLEGIGLPGGPRDVVVVGAGPGGLAAAVMGGTDGLDTLFVDANPEPGGQAKYSSRIENYPGFPVGATGADLTGRMYEQAVRVGAEGKLGVRVTGLSYDEGSGLKTLTLSNGETVEARTVIVAGGVEFKKLDFPGSDSPNVIYGDGKKLAQEAAGGSAVVVGGSNGAAQAALGAAQKADKVYVISRSPIEKGMSDYQVQALRNHPKIEVIESDEIGRLRTDDQRRASALVTKGGREIACDALGIFVGGASNLSWLPPSVAREGGKVAVNSDLETTIPGVFAVGDIRSGSIGRIGAAVGDGQMAERNVFRYFDRMKSKGQLRASARRAKDDDAQRWDALVDDLFALDREHPFLGQTLDPVDDLRTADAEFEAKHPRDKGGQFASVSDPSESAKPVGRVARQLAKAKRDVKFRMYPPKPIKMSAEEYASAMRELGGAGVETHLTLDPKTRAVVNAVSHGMRGETEADISEGMISLHNHPGGSNEPSSSDWKIAEYYDVPSMIIVSHRFPSGEIVEVEFERPASGWPKWETVEPVVERAREDSLKSLDARLARGESYVQGQAGRESSVAVVDAISKLVNVNTRLYPPTRKSKALVEDEGGVKVKPTT